VREIVLIISDLYLAPVESGNSSKLGEAGSLPGLEYIARFGKKSAIDEGWRSWLARWAGRDDLANVAPAAIAAASHGDPEPADSAGAIWFATPLHLIAGLTSLHLDRRSILSLTENESRELIQDFVRVFWDSEFSLETIESGIFLMRSRTAISVETTEPARVVVSDLQAVLPTGPGAPGLRRFGAELEMWLHGHPVNQQRAARGEPPVSTLWLWGGGRTPAGVGLNAPDIAAAEGGAMTDVGFGADPFVVGLWRLQGLEPLSLPERLPQSESYPDARKVVLVAAATPLLHANPHWTIFEALVDLDRRFIEPALEQLRAGKVSSVVLIANDTQLRIKRRDILRFWRRARKSGVEALRGN
jgi:hypothetical protein